MATSDVERNGQTNETKKIDKYPYWGSKVSSSPRTKSKRTILKPAKTAKEKNDNWNGDARIAMTKATGKKTKRSISNLNAEGKGPAQQHAPEVKIISGHPDRTPC